MKRKVKVGCLIVGVLLAVLILAVVGLTARAMSKRADAAKHPPPVLGWDQIRHVPDLQYMPGPDADAERHTLDLFLPLTGENWPVAVVVHGGSFLFNAKETMANVGIALARHGVAAAIVNYRLVPKAWPPGQMHDVSRAVAWVHANGPAHGYDAQRLYIVAHSAGAFLSALAIFRADGLQAAGMPPTAVRGAALVSGFYDIHDVPLPQRFAFGLLPSGWKNDSPITHLNADSPPLLIAYAEHDIDRPAPVAKACRNFHASLRAAGVEAELVEIADANHLTIMGDIGRRPSGMLTRLLEMIAPEPAD